MTTPQDPRPTGRRPLRRLPGRLPARAFAALAVGAIALGVVAAATDLPAAFGLTASTATASPTVFAPVPSSASSVDATATAVASPSQDSPSTPAPTPNELVRAPVDVDLLADPRAPFVSEVTNKLCAAAGVQIVVNILTGHPDLSSARQLAIHDLEVRLTTTADSHNGGAGPEGMAATIGQLSGVTYELRIYPSRDAALRAAAIAVESQGQPVVLLAWRGAHTWVMTGFRADADPALFADASVSGAYILDPWFPRISRIWGPSDPPGTFQDSAEMVRNFLPWKRPEGRYPGRDGQFLILVPASAP